MIEILLAMVYVGGGIGCWLALWDYDNGSVHTLKQEHRVTAAVLALVIAYFWPVVLTACLVRSALENE